MRNTSPFFTWARFRTSGPATIVTVLPSAPFRVTWRVFWLILTTVAVPVTVFSPMCPDGEAGGGVTAARAGDTGSGRGVDFLAAQPASAPAQSTIPIVLSFISTLQSLVAAASRNGDRGFRAAVRESELQGPAHDIPRAPRSSCHFAPARRRQRRRIIRAFR